MFQAPLVHTFNLGTSRAGRVISEFVAKYKFSEARIIKETSLKKQQKDKNNEVASLIYIVPSRLS